MNGKQIYRSLVLFGTACCLSASLSGVAQGAQMVLHARLTGNDQMWGTVEYVVHGRGYRTLHCDIFSANRDQFLAVVIRRNKEWVNLGWCPVNRRGQATIELTTLYGHYIPMLKRGDIVEVWTRNHVRVLSGRLQ